MSQRLIELFFEFGFVLVFGILGITTFCLHIPKEKGIESYKKARFALGGSLSILSAYCIIRFILPLHHTAYLDFWLLVTFTLIHSWLTYSAMLFLLETPRFRTRHFIIDGIAPITIMLICGFIGLIFTSAQKWMQGAFGFIFALKCAYMFYACLREYNLCKKELNNFYDNYTDIRWIKGLIFLSLFMSVVTIVTFYVTSLQMIYYLSIPIIYTFIVFKVINFAPKKIDTIRSQNVIQEKPVTEKKTNKRHRRKDRASCFHLGGREEILYSRSFNQGCSLRNRNKPQLSVSIPKQQPGDEFSDMAQHVKNRGEQDLAYRWCETIN